MTANDELLSEVRVTLSLRDTKEVSEEMLESLILHFACLYGKSDEATGKLLRKNIDYIKGDTSETI